MIPMANKAFLVSNLVSGMQYDLCVLAIWEDTATALTATNIVGCVQFTTTDDYPQCQSLHSGFLGGTMILVIGGVIVATLLVFIVILMVRYKATGSGVPAGKLPSVSNTYSQTNGGLNRLNGAQPLAKPTVVVLHEEMVEFKCGSLQSSLSSSSNSSNSLDRGPADHYSLQASECSTLPHSGKFRRHGPGAKGRPHLDHLLGAFASLELRSVTVKEHQEAAGCSVTTTGMMTVAVVPPSDKEPLLGRAESTTMLGRLLGLPQESKPKRSHSFDMGHAQGAAQCVSSYPRRISNIWTKRSVSVNGMLLQYDDSEEEKPSLESSEWVMESTV